MTLFNEIILSIGIICCNISVFIFGIMHERYKWNQLIKKGIIPHPKDKI